MRHFIENKYRRWYFNIIDRRQRTVPSGYIERHHIIPTSLGGSDDSSNIVALTAREHFVCHLLLVKITSGKDKMKMQFAVNFNRHAKNGHVPSSRMYELLRKWNSEALSRLHSGRKLSQADKDKKSIAALNLSQEKRDRKAAALKKPKSPETIARMSAAQLKRPKAACSQCSGVFAVNILSRYHNTKCRR